MRIDTKHPSETEAVITISANATELAPIKEHVLQHLAPNVKVPGFREGKAPSNLIEKQVDQATLQTEFLEHAVSHLYPEAVQQAGIRPVDRPEVELKKFVPFTELEFQVRVAVVGKVKLADYKKTKKAPPVIKIGKKDIDEVIAALQKRAAERKEVKREARTGDVVTIDFNGVNEAGEPVKGAEGKDYPLELGSNSFIPGFEDEVSGLKAGETKTFTLKFPQDYGVKALANRKVTFTVTVTAVNELVLPKLDDAFAASVGPVKTVKDLREDIKRELQAEKQRQADLEYESELVRELTEKSSVTVPPVLIEDQIERMMADLKQNLIYRGQTIKEFLEAEGKSDEEYRQEVLKPQAEERVKASLVLAEVADKENLQVMPEELEIRIQALKSQYQDQAMQAELDKPENRREIASRLLSEKTVAVLANYAKK